ncbi:biogenesis of lysosome-related organelles complex 1 subunit 1-like [Sarcoptes scabiei]|nr:biogenesis of lysosome-related organelles complex 1 subunit 1-like [Sarcoptes scabiei]
MSATLKEICVVNDLDQIKQILMPENKTKQEIFRDDDWDNRWNWDTSELVYDDELDEKKNLWINECCIAISPFLDTLVLGRLQTISIFHINNSNDNVIKNTFNMVYTTTLSADQPEESITCILLLPFVSHQKSAANFRDWTAILCGFTSGFFRIYSENGKTLLSNSFHNEPVLNIECRTYSASSLLTEQTDEIVIVYPSAVIQIDGFTLLQTLRICRNRLSRSDVNDYKSSGYFDINDNQTKFTFKKWLFETASEGRINDCKNVCSFIKNNFDALVSHSISGSKTLSNDFGDLFITTGSDPYVGFYRAKEVIKRTIFRIYTIVLN